MLETQNLAHRKIRNTNESFVEEILWRKFQMHIDQPCVCIFGYLINGDDHLIDYKLFTKLTRKIVMIKMSDV